MPLFIPKAIESILRGVIRIPAFQRGFVWEPESVAYLMDSIYKGYPFGSVILWRTREQLHSERRLGPFPLIDKEPQYPIDYVLDGQQRLTSIFGVFQTEILPIEDAPWIRIYFDLEAPAGHQDSQFLALMDSEVDPERHFPIKTFFDVPGYRQATRYLSDQKADYVEYARSVFQQAVVPTQYIETDDRSSVAIVFERVNRMGEELDVLQLLTAWTWSDEFDLRAEFEELAVELEPFGFRGVGEDTNLLLRCCAGVIAGDSAPGALIKINGSTVREHFREIVNGIQGAIDFLRRNLQVRSLSNLPYSTMLVPLTNFFAVPDRTSVKLTDNQRRVLVRWFWRSCFSRRYSAGTIRNLNRDIAEAAKLRDGESSSLDDIPTEVTESFFRQRFTVNSVHTNTFVLLLANRKPRSFVSGAPIDLGKVLQSYNRNEFHHLYPQAYLKSIGTPTANINMLANFAFVSSADNKTLGGCRPSEYKLKMPQSSISEILKHADCPENLFSDDYGKFINHRTKFLARSANELIS